MLIIRFTVVSVQHPGATEAGLMYMIDYARRHGNRAVRLWFGPFRPLVRLVHPDTVKLILGTAEPKVLSSGGYSFLRPWLGNAALQLQHTLSIVLGCWMIASLRHLHGAIQSNAVGR